MSFNKLVQLTTGYVPARIVQAAVMLGLFAAVGNENKTAATIAKEIGCDQRGCGILLNALVALQLIKKTKTDNRWCYVLTEMAQEFLLPSSPKYLGGMLEYNARNWQIWGGLEEVVKTGQPQSLGRPIYRERLLKDADFAGEFTAAMHSICQARGDAESIASRLDLSDKKRLLDVGCGPAVYAAAFLQRHASLHAVGLDLPFTIEAARPYVEKSGVADRLQLLSGNYLEDDLGKEEYDVVFLSNIIHQENEEMNRGLFAKIVQALVPGGLFVIKDHIMDPSLTQPADGAVFAVRMLLFNEGRCYALEEVNQWLKVAGFSNIQVLPPEPPMTSMLLLAVKS